MSAPAQPPMGPMPGVGTLPARVSAAQLSGPNLPAASAPLAPIAFTRDPHLRELLHPNVVIRPGLTYLACALPNVPYAESQGFTVMPHQRTFSVRGVPCMLMIRGTPIPGARAESQLVLLHIDRATDPVPVGIEAATAEPSGPSEPPEAPDVKLDDTEDLPPLSPAAQAALDRATGRKK